MLDCKRCKVQSRVIDTRYTPNQIPPYIRRTRLCPKCDRRWTTVEMMAGESKTAKQRTRGKNGLPVMNDVRRTAYATVADELHQLADRVATRGFK